MDNMVYFLPVLAALGLSLATGPLGSLIVWRRMAYFGDATAHASVLGVALAIAFGLPIYLGVLLVALGMAFVVTNLAAKGQNIDTTLGVMAFSALSLGLVAISFTDQPDVDLEGFLFGDIMAVTALDVGIIWGGAGAIIGGIAWRWSSLLTSTLNADLAVASGINPKREQLMLTLALAVVVAMSIKVVGALLIGAMLLIPAAAARGVSRTPEGMVKAAVLVGIIASLTGLGAAYLWATPVGPSIVVAAAVMFFASGYLQPKG